MPGGGKRERESKSERNIIKLQISDANAHVIHNFALIMKNPRENDRGIEGGRRRKINFTIS